MTDVEDEHLEDTGEVDGADVEEQSQDLAEDEFDDDEDESAPDLGDFDDDAEEDDEDIDAVVEMSNKEQSARSLEIRRAIEERREQRKLSEDLDYLDLDPDD